MPAPRRRIPRELFETRSHSWHAVGLGEELEPRAPKRSIGWLLVSLAVIAGTLIVYDRRRELFPGYGPVVKGATAVILIIVGSAAVHWLVRGVTPRLFRRLDPATAGTIGFLIRLFSMAVVVFAALRIAGVTAATLAVGGAFTAVVLGLAAQQTLGSLIAGIVLQSVRPFRVGERVRLVGGLLAGSIEGTVSSLGLFYTTLVQGADRLQVPNSVLINLVVVPLREPEKVDVRVRFDAATSPRAVEEQLIRSIRVPTRYAPSVSLEEVDEDGVALRINATPLRSGDGSQLADELLEALRGMPSSAGGQPSMDAERERL